MSKFVIDKDGNRVRIKTEADRMAARKWKAAHRSEHALMAYYARKDYSDRVRAVAEANGTTVSAIIHAALDAYLSEHETPTIE